MWIKKVVAIACLLAAGVVAVEGDAKHASILDGKPKSFVVVGYSTSFMWPTMLQFMLDGHTEEAGVYPVMNAVVGGSPVVNWLKGHKRYGKTYGKLVSNYLSDDAEKLVGRDRPTVALCQQSLQGAFGERAAGIRGKDDVDRIRIGADTFARLADQLHEDGIEVVYMATHIYKEPMEPGIENEKYALRALLDRNSSFIRPGPELWGPTKAVYPDGFSRADKVHPSFASARIMAEGWYRSLAGDDAREDVIRAMFAEPFPDIEKAEVRREARRVERRNAR